MTDCIAIRTHKWGVEEDRLVAALAPVFGDDIVVAFHNRPEDVQPPVRVANFNDRWVRSNKLRPVGDYGWRCGDYALYAARLAFPEYDRYWLIEPDVLINGDVAAFFAEAAQRPEDGLGVDFRKQSLDENRFVKGLPAGMTPYKATFALTRFSGKAIDYLLEARRAYSKNTAVGFNRFTNDETFCFSHLASHTDFTVGGLAEQMPEWFNRKMFSPDPDRFDRAIFAELGDENQVCHPVHPLSEFIEAVSKRVAVNSFAFFRNMGPSFAEMSDDEIKVFADRVGARIYDVARNLKNKARS
ncbi:component of SufBCD complex [Celeribacter litoreus]|uniref:component of SufBCD complex n=1 Tax=Celeribacter litoreus TaxID=2876714 RepID=UPI001CC926FA|nr:component of SufBCD complex [Celeribacter litoreus]MCA0043886.1 component of SufBCD complex [Celeribacter litoreus]